MGKNVWKHILKVTGVLALFVALFILLNLLLQPKYMEDLVEGSMLSQYYGEAGGHDVIFLGDCEVYANFTPLELYRTAGITAYVRGSSQQQLWQSYYLLRETFTYEIPKAVVFNVNAMRYGEPVSEAFNRLTADKMKWSKDKAELILVSMTGEEQFLSYVFPILRYHSRFDELTGEDLRYLFTRKDTTWMGHLVNREVKHCESVPAVRPQPSYDFAEICWDYLDRIRQLCEENGVELILVKAPSLYPHWYDQYEEQIRAYGEEHGLAYYNFLDDAAEMGIDYTLDTYDAGLHLNLSGATKLSVWFARILAEEHGLPDHRNDPALAEKWNSRLKAYDEYLKSTEVEK